MLTLALKSVEPLPIETVLGALPDPKDTDELEDELETLTL
jgi:hypothetical protein